MKKPVFCQALYSLGCAVMWLPLSQAQAEDVSFQQDIRPILSNHCFHCHGPDEEHRQADLRLDVASDFDLEELLDRVTADDPDWIMPPPDAKKDLSKSQIEKLKSWVEQGGTYEQHWAFQSQTQVTVPEVRDGSWGEQPIDAFVLARLKDHKWRPNPPADKWTLIRRVTMDLTGLPPTLAEIERFVSDDSPNAYEKLVDRLLDSPHYGEHMARYWLDLVRFADTNGLHHDHYREMTPYRDWVIRSFNDNLSYDRFTTYQLAGDLLPEPTSEQLVASGFNRLHLIIDRGTALPEESFMRNVVDRVSAVGTAFLGLTLECAVCHDHKYDPITQRDFYQLYAFFNNFDGQPETGGRRGLDFKRGLQPPYLELPSAEQSQQREALEAEIAQLKSQLESLKVAAASPQAGTDLQQQQEELTATLSGRQSSLDQLIESIPATLIMRERAEIRPAHIMVRGNYDQPGELVQRDTPSFLPGLEPIEGTPDRLDLAHWLVAPEHPLTARVAVNRFWQQIFGVGLVKTSEDFGAQGEPPSHPGLLDYLAGRFVESGWDVKALMRSLVLSETYRQSSHADSDRFVADPENRLLARGSRYRYDAEVIRDAVLAYSGLLDRSLYGKSVKPPQPEGLWETVAMPSSYPRVYEADQGSRIYRRSVYSFWKRALPPPQMTIFDAPTRESCTARRERTNTPLQALVMMNEQQYFLAAMKLAQDIQSTANDDSQRLAIAYQTVTARPMSTATERVLTQALKEFRSLYAQDAQAAGRMLEAAKQSQAAIQIPGSSEEQAELAAWTMLVHSLFNLDVTKTRE